MAKHPRGLMRPGTGPVKHVVLAILVAIALVTPVSAATQSVSPAIGSLDPEDSFASLLSLVPQTMEGLVNPADFPVYYSDFSAQLSTVGIEPPDSIDDERIRDWQAEVSRTLLPPNDAFTNLPFWREDYGFDLLQADQTLEAGVAPYHLSLYRGRFDEQAIIQALEEVGYQPVSEDEPAIWSVRDDHEFDMNAPTAYKLANMNFGTILDDGTLVFASSLGIIQSVVDVAQGNAPAFTERPEISSLVSAAPDDLVSAMLVNGEELAGADPVGALASGTPDLDAIATRVAEDMESRGEMPPVRHVLLGVTAGWSAGAGSDTPEQPDGVPAARNVAIAHLLSDADAQAAVPVIDERLATGEPLSAPPFREIYSEWTVEALAGTPVVRIDLVPGETTTPRAIYELAISRSLTFLAW